MTKQIPSPGPAAKYGTLEVFLSAVEARPDIDWKKYFGWALRNKDLEARLAIANWMLDHGMDESVSYDGDNINGLHVLFSDRRHDVPGEARLLQRMFDAGADINLRSPRFGVPLWILMRESGLKDAELGPFYDVIFSQPGIDWGIVCARGVSEPLTLARYVENSKDLQPEMYRRMCEYLEHGPSPRPVFDEEEGEDQ